MAAVHAAAMPPGDSWSAAAIGTQLALPNTFGLLHVRGGMVLAQVVADEAEILALAVTVQARRQGCGAALLQAAEARAAALGARTMYLEVAENNSAARALYHRTGYAVSGRRRGYYADGGDALVLRKPLTPRGAAAGG